MLWGQFGMQSKRTTAVLHLSSVRTDWIKAIFYLGGAESFISSSFVKLYFQTRKDIPFAPAVAWWRIASLQGPWKTTRERCVLDYKSSCCFSCLIWNQNSVSVFEQGFDSCRDTLPDPLPNPSIGWDKDMMTV